MPLERVTKAVGNNFNPTGAPDSIVLPFEKRRYLFLRAETKTLCYQPTERVPSAKRTNPRTLFLQCDGHTTGQKRSQEPGRLSVRKLIHGCNQSTGEGPRFSSVALLKVERGIPEEASSGGW